jgi:hypothetical protein
MTYSRINKLVVILFLRDASVDKEIKDAVFPREFLDTQLTLVLEHMLDDSPLLIV